MSNYTQSTNFATKDALPSGDPLKIVKGTEINTEFANIAIAVATKQDIPSLTANGVLYSNASNVITSGNALTFDGTNFQVVGTNVVVKSIGSSGYGSFYATGATGNAAYYFFGVGASETARIYSDASNYMAFGTGSAGLEKMRIASDGNIVVGLAAPTAAGGGRSIDIYNTVATNNNSSSVLRLITSSVAGGGGEFGADIYKTKGGALVLNNNEIDSVAYIGFGIGVTERMRLDSSGVLTLNSVPVVTTTGTQTLTNKTLTSPTITGASVSSMASSVITSGTAIATTSGTLHNFTGIPSWVKRVTVMFNDVSTGGTSDLQVQLGDSGGVETTGYASVSAATGGGTQITPTAVVTTGMVVKNETGAGASFQGTVVFVNISGTTWTQSHSVVDTGTARCIFGSGAKTLSGTLDRVRITTVSGDTFDAGSVNILYE